MTNPLLQDWDTPFALPPFDKIEDSHFEPAVDKALEDARLAITAIAENDDAATFANTIDALERADRDLGRILSVFYHLAGTSSNDERERLQREFSPKLSAYSSWVGMHRGLWARIDAIWQNRENLKLTAEQERVLFLTHRGFRRAGAELEDYARDRLTEVNAQLSMLGTQFTQNLLADERAWHMELDEAELEGLPDFVVEAARAAGKEKGLNGPAITLSRSLIVPFLQFSPRRDLRERAYAAWTSRGMNGGETDNRDIATQILALREERASLLGYDSFADFKLETQMAKTPAAVRDLLMEVWEPAKAAADEDALRLGAMMHNDGVNEELQPWDWRFYSERRRAEEHDLNEAELKPYFQLDRMIEAAFSVAHRLFGIDAKPLDSALPHPDARAWEITRDGEHLAIFIGDYFARAGKRSGAWCSTLRDQTKLDEDVRPIVVNVCNFAKPPEGKHALLSYDDARTLFHEFGHALHQMLSDVTYERISGTSVARDFVELPSQLYEHWLEVPEVLKEFAVHADTGEAIPEALLDRLLAARTYDMGFQTVEFLASALVDLDFHTGEAPDDAMTAQAETLERIEMPSAIGMRHATPHFAHVFAGDGYSAGYYSYMWSEVMDADAFEAFEEARGPFDAEMAKKLEEYILSVGGSEEADVLYKKFRGRMPDTAALLRGRGLAA